MGAILEEASMRGFVALGTVVVLLIGTAPAIAKGAGSVEVVGHDVEVGDSSFGRLERATERATFGRLERATRFYDSVFRTDGPVVAAPAGSRGPRVTLLWSVISPRGDVPVRQDLYPWAEAGPMTFIPAGQPFIFVSEPTMGGWFPAAGDLADVLDGLGIDRESAVSAGGFPEPVDGWYLRAMSGGQKDVRSAVTERPYLQFLQAIKRAGAAAGMVPPVLAWGILSSSHQPHW